MRDKIFRENLRKLFLPLLLVASILIISGCTDKAATESTNNNAEGTMVTAGPNTDTYPDTNKTANYFGNTNANLANGGLAAIQGDWIYYCTSEGLFKINIDGTGEQLLFSDATENNCIYHINVVGDWVYYENFIEGIRSQYRIKTNGTERQLIGDGRQTHVIGDALYWFDRPIGYRMSIDSTDSQIIFQESVSSDYTVNIFEDWIYFCIEGDDGKYGIYKIRTDGTEKTCLYSGRTDYLIVDGDFVYFEGYRDCNLYRMKLDGSELTLVFDDPLEWSFNISDGWIYYCNQDDFCMYRVRTDGTEKQKISSDWANDMCVVGEWIYYKAVVTTETSAYDMQCRIKTDGTERQELGIRDEVYRGDNPTAPAKADSEENNETVPKDLNTGDFSSFAGTYSIHPQFSYYGDYYPASIVLDEAGVITGKNISNAAPIYITKNSNGTLTCMISEGEQYFDEVVGMMYMTKPKEFYVICPIGVTSGFDDYPDYDYLGTDAVRIRYIIIDGGIADIMYFKN